MPLPALYCRPVQAVVKMVMASDLSLRGRFAPVAISQYPVGSWGSYRRNRSCLPEIATAPSGPRNDKSGYLKPWNPCQRNRNCLWRSLSAATFSLARWAYAGERRYRCNWFVRFIVAPVSTTQKEAPIGRICFEPNSENAFSSAARWSGTSMKRTITLPRPEAASRPIPIPARWGSPMRLSDD